MSKSKTRREIVGKSDIQSVTDSLHIHSPLNNEYQLISTQETTADNYELNDNQVKKRHRLRMKKDARQKNIGTRLLNRQVSTYARCDLFQAARDGHIDQLKLLQENNYANRKLFFNEQDEAKLTALHYAARYYHFNVCKYLIEDCQADVNSHGENGATPLHWASRFKFEKDNQNDSYDKVIPYLIQKGANVNTRDDCYSTPLHYACESNNRRCAELLLENYADIEALDSSMMTPLHRACFYGHIESARLLLEHDANPVCKDDTEAIPLAYACRGGHLNLMMMYFDEFSDHDKLEEVITAKDGEGNTILHLAVSSANLKLIDLLLAKGCDHSATRNDGQSAVHIAARTGSIEILRRLVEYGADLYAVDIESENVLHKAAFHNKENILDYVLSIPKDNFSSFINQTNRTGLTPLLLASERGHAWCIHLLLQYGADMFSHRDKRERSALWLASMANHLEAVQELINFAQTQTTSTKDYLTISINEMDRYNKAPIHIAAECGNVEIVHVLLENGGKLTMKTDEEQTPLMLCAKKCRVEVVKLIIDYVNANYKTLRDKLNIMEERDDTSNTALHIACAEGHSAIIKLLLEQNVDIQARNMISWMPIHCASERGHYTSVKVLLENRSLVDPVDKNQQTPLHLAAKNGHSEIIKLLLNNGAKIDKCTSDGDNCLDLAILNNQYLAAETLVSHEDWCLIMRNAKYDPKLQRMDTPLRKLIRKMPDVALIVLNNCCKTTPIEQKQTKDSEKNHINILQLSHQDDATQQTKKYKLEYTYEFLDDQFNQWEKETENREDIYEPDGRLYPWVYSQIIDRKKLQQNHPLMLMVEKNRERLLDHPIVHSLLDYKWKLYAGYVYYLNFLFYLIFVGILTSYVFLSIAPYHFGVTHDQMKQLSCKNICMSIIENRTIEINERRSRILAIHIVQWTVIVLASLQIIKEIFQMISEQLDYINFENLVELSAFVLAILFTIDFNSCSREIGYRCSTQWQLGSLAVFLSWFSLVLFIQKFPRFGIFVVMLTDILRTFSRFFLVFFLFVIGFALAFHMLLQNHNPFQRFGDSLLKTCVMMVGELEYEGIFHSEEPNYFAITYLFFIIFIIVMSVIIMNLLIGLAVDDISSVMRSALLKRLAMRVKLTLDVERQLPRNSFFRTIRRSRTVTYHKSKLQKFLSKFLRIQTTTNYDKQYLLLDAYGLINTNKGTKSQVGGTDVLMLNDTNKDATTSIGTGASIINQIDWIQTFHSKISEKYNEFNRHMNDLKIQQDKINTILQQYSQSSTKSRQSSHLTFAPVTT